jgi:transposase
MRMHKCPYCRVELDRDTNAAINIRNSTVGATGTYVSVEIEPLLSRQLKSKLYH